MKGFSLVELLVALLLSALVLISVIQLTQTLAGLRTQFDRLNSLHFSQEACRRRITDRFKHQEPDFWRQFPPKENTIHPGSQGIEGRIVSAHCPQGDHSGCLQIWDIAPTSLSGLVFDIDPTYLPYEVVITGTSGPSPGMEDPTFEPAAHIEAGTVILVFDETEAQPLVVRKAIGAGLRTADPDKQPWPVRTDWSERKWSVIVLGDLQIFHFLLRRAPKRKYALAEQVIRFNEGGLTYGPALSSESFIEALTLPSDTETETPGFWLHHKFPGETQTIRQFITL